MATDRIALVIQLMIIMSATMVVLAICVTVVASIALRKTEKGAARTLSLMIERAGALQLMTVVTIVMSVLVLRILDALGADATVSVLSGIAESRAMCLAVLRDLRGATANLKKCHNQTDPLPGTLTT